MAVSIRHRFNYANVVINENKVVMGRAISHTSIPAKLKNGELLYKPFGGVMDYQSECRRVKLVNIEKFWWNEDGFGDGIEIPNGHALLGFYDHDRFYIAIRDDKPIHWEIEPDRPSYFTDNIVPMNRP